MHAMTRPQFHRLAETARMPLRLTIDGRSTEALKGDTLLTAILVNARRLNINQFDRTPRAGFCLMGACQDCWVRLEGGERLRACGSFAADGMRVITHGG